MSGARTRPWALYDDLVDGVPGRPGVRAAEMLGSWALVESDDGCVGAASHYGGRSRPRVHRGRLEGMRLRDAAALVRSWNLVEASLGAAALNAWYNRFEHLAGAGRDLTPPGGGGSAFAVFRERVRGRRVGVVGHFPGLDRALGDVCRLIVLERAPQEGDFPDTAAEYLLPDQDVVFITGSALANKTLPRLLQLSRRAWTVLVGPSTPLAPVLHDYGVDCLSGSVLPGPIAANRSRLPSARRSVTGGTMVNLVPAHGEGPGRCA